MAPVNFTRPPDLSGRTPIYRLSKNPERVSTPKPTTSSQAVNANPSPNPGPYQYPYHAYTQSPSQPPPNPPNPANPPAQATPQDNTENAYAQSPQNANANANPTPNATTTVTPNASQNSSSPLTKRRGRKLQEDETLTLVNCCLEYQSLYHDNPSRFWYCVATSLKRQIKRNFSAQSCRQIVEELVGERRERRRDVAAGKAKEQPITELVLATDQWISFSDAPPRPNIASSSPGDAGSNALKRGSQDAIEIDAVKRVKSFEQNPPSPLSVHQPVTQPQLMPPYHIQNPVPTVPSGPTMSEFQSLKVDIRGLRMDVQSMRKEMVEVRQELTTKLDLILQHLQGKTNESTDES